MQFTVGREALLKPLTLVSGVVERRQTLPVLSNILFTLDGSALSLTGTDLEVELISSVDVQSADDAGSVTIPARKLMDICRRLPEGAEIQVSVSEGRAVVRSGRSRFALATLPAAEFPDLEETDGQLEITVPKASVKELIDRTAFAMAQQDVRYFLNGMLLEVAPGHLRAVATDGHRMAMCTVSQASEVAEESRVIVPRKGVIELGRLLAEPEGDVTLVVGANHLRVRTDDYTLTTKLVDGQFPPYERVVPKKGDKVMVADRDSLRQALSRTAILSNEKYKQIRLALGEEMLNIVANNPEQEEAEESVAVDYNGGELEIGFNVEYLLDVLGAVSGESVQFTMTDANSSALIEDPGQESYLYVVSPMRF